MSWSDFCSESLRSIDKTVMRAQVIELILDILATTDVQSEARHRLLQHLALHPGSPEQALLCHLSENACLPPAAGAETTSQPGRLTGRNKAAGTPMKDRSRGGSRPSCGTCCGATDVDRPLTRAADKDGRRRPASGGQLRWWAISQPAICWARLEARKSPSVAEMMEPFIRMCQERANSSVAFAAPLPRRAPGCGPRILAR